MITVAETGNTYDLRGLSSDSKPTKVKLPTGKEVTLGNGSTFFEIDTGNAYMFDAYSEQ